MATIFCLLFGKSNAWDVCVFWSHPIHLLFICSWRAMLCKMLTNRIWFYLRGSDGETWYRIDWNFHNNLYSYVYVFHLLNLCFKYSFVELWVSNCIHNILCLSLFSLSFHKCNAEEEHWKVWNDFFTHYKKVK